jgi:polar amino acid transport system substrate-binding protein
MLSAALRAAPAMQDAVPTLVPPTLVPIVESGMIDALPSESAIARIRASSVLRVGILFNEPPFGELNIRGEVSGFDADLARAMAEAWGIQAELVQVTRQTAIEMLLAGDVDVLMAAQPRSRDLDSRVEFSQAYYPNAQMMAVREGDGAAVLGHMEGRKVGVVLGTRGERAVSDWMTRSRVNATIQTYLTLDQALTALLAQEVDGVVENRLKLERAIAAQPGVMRFVAEPVGAEPYAVVMRRQDVNMRNLVDRTLQYLVDTGRMNELHRRYFAGAAYPGDRFALWADIGDEAPRLDQYSVEMQFPQQYAVPRIQSAGVVRVAGVQALPEDAAESERALDGYNRALVEAMASRWGVRVEYIPDSGANALDLVAAGQADLAIGEEPTWNCCTANACSWKKRAPSTALATCAGAGLACLPARTVWKSGCVHVPKNNGRLFGVCTSSTANPVSLRA